MARLDSKSFAEWLDQNVTTHRHPDYAAVTISLKGIGEVPGDVELRNRLAVYTFRMCTEAIKALVEKNLSERIFMWGHSTGGEYFYLMEQYGLKNKLIGGLGFATIFTLFLTPVAYRFLAPLSKPRVHETKLLVEELKAAGGAASHT